MFKQSKKLPSGICADCWGVQGINFDLKNKRVVAYLALYLDEASMEGGCDPVHVERIEIGSDKFDKLGTDLLRALSALAEDLYNEIPVEEASQNRQEKAKEDVEEVAPQSFFSRLNPFK